MHKKNMDTTNEILAGSIHNDTCRTLYCGTRAAGHVLQDTGLYVAGRVLQDTGLYVAGHKSCTGNMHMLDNLILLMTSSSDITPHDGESFVRVQIITHFS